MFQKSSLLLHFKVMSPKLNFTPFLLPDTVSLPSLLSKDKKSSLWDKVISSIWLFAL